MASKSAPLPRVPGGEFEQLVAQLRHVKRLHVQRQRFGFGADAAIFIRPQRPAQASKPPMPLLFTSGRGRR